MIYKKVLLTISVFFIFASPFYGIANAQTLDLGGKIVAWIPCVTGFVIFVFPPSLVGIGPYYVPFVTTKAPFRPPLPYDTIVGKFFVAPVPACLLSPFPPVFFPIPQFPIIESSLSF